MLRLSRSRRKLTDRRPCHSSNLAFSSKVSNRGCGPQFALHLICDLDCSRKAHADFKRLDVLASIRFEGPLALSPCTWRQFVRRHHWFGEGQVQAITTWPVVAVW